MINPITAGPLAGVSVETQKRRSHPTFLDGSKRRGLRERKGGIPGQTIIDKGCVSWGTLTHTVGAGSVLDPSTLEIW